jgi:SAM-dependent methyltransferase
MSDSFDPRVVRARFLGKLNDAVRELDLPPPSKLRARLARVRNRIERRLFLRGVDTSGWEFEPEHFHRERVGYQPSSWVFLASVLRRREVRPDDVFVDFGSGKGQVVYQAARYRFARVIGVEISPRLTEMAERNIERNRGRLKCRDISLVTSDAAEFEIPDDMTVGYFYFPFSGDTFRTVIDNIVRSLDRNPRDVRLIYALPALEKEILATGRFERVRTRRIAHTMGRQVSMYASRPAPEEERA